MLQAVASGAAIRGIVWLDEQGVALLGFTVTVGATRNETDSVAAPHLTCLHGWCWFLLRLQASAPVSRSRGGGVGPHQEVFIANTVTGAVTVLDVDSCVPRHELAGTAGTGGGSGSGAGLTATPSSVGQWVRDTHSLGSRAALRRCGGETRHHGHHVSASKLGLGACVDPSQPGQREEEGAMPRRAVAAAITQVVLSGRHGMALLVRDQVMVVLVSYKEVALSIPSSTALSWLWLFGYMCAAGSC